MSKKAILKTDVYDFLLNYFEARYKKSLSRQIKRDDVYSKKLPSIKSIVDLVAANERYFVMNDGNKSKKPTIEQIVVSRDTIRKAVEMLLKDGKIAITKGSYEFVPQMETSLEQFSILKIAKSVDVSIGVPSEMVVLTVDPEYAISLTNFLSALFYRGDIVFIPIFDKILCISLIPKRELHTISDPEDDSCTDLHRRIQTSLLQFNSSFPDFIYGQRYEDAYNFSNNSKVSDNFQKRLGDILSEFGYTSPSDAGNFIRAYRETLHEMAEEGYTTDVSKTKKGQQSH